MTQACRTAIRGLIKNRGLGMYARGGEVASHPMAGPMSNYVRRAVTSHPMGSPVVVHLGEFAMPADTYAKHPPIAEPVNGRPTHWNVQIIDGIAYGQQEWSE